MCVRDYVVRVSESALVCLFCDAAVVKGAWVWEAIHFWRVKRMLLCVIESARFGPYGVVQVLTRSFYLITKSDSGNGGVFVCFCGRRCCPRVCMCVSDASWLHRCACGWGFLFIIVIILLQIM